MSEYQKAVDLGLYDGTEEQYNALSQAPLDVMKRQSDIYAAEREQQASDFSEDPYEEQSWQGDLDYQELNPEALESLSDTELSNIEAQDPRYAEAELASLKQLEEMSSEGFTERDKADMAAIEASNNRNLRGQRGAIEQNMQARGISGSGLEMVAQQQAIQDAADRQALQGLEKSAMMQDRKRGATMDLGNMSSQLTSRDYAQQANRAAAQDSINKFNVANTVQTQQANNAGQNQATSYNHQNQQQIANNNVATGNQYQNDVYNAQMGAADSSFNARQDAQQTAFNAQIEEANRRELEKQRKAAKKSGQMGAVMGVGGAVVGGIYGGPAGAAAGASAGSALGSAFGAHGGKIPEDSYMNDTETVTVSPGEIIVPKSLANDPDAVADFVSMIQAQGTEGHIDQRNPTYIPGNTEIEEPDEEDVIDSFLNIMAHMNKRKK